MSEFAIIGIGFLIIMGVIVAGSPLFFVTYMAFFESGYCVPWIMLVILIIAAIAVCKKKKSWALAKKSILIFAVVGVVLFVITSIGSQHDAYWDSCDLDFPMKMWFQCVAMMLPCIYTIIRGYTMPENVQPSDEIDEEVHEEPEMDSGHTASDLLRAMIDKAPDYSTEKALEDLLQAYEEIEDTLKDNPDYENMEDIRNLRTGYLPKILELSDRLVQEKCSPEMKSKVTDVIALCTNAFRNINKKMIAADDLQTAGDLAVLKDSLVRKGLLDSDFKLEEKDYEKDEEDFIDFLIAKYLVEKMRGEDVELKDIITGEILFGSEDAEEDSCGSDFEYDDYECDDVDEDSDYSYRQDDEMEQEESDFEDWLFNNDDRW